MKMSNEETKPLHTNQLSTELHLCRWRTVNQEISFTAINPLGQGSSKYGSQPITGSKGPAVWVAGSPK